MFLTDRKLERRISEIEQYRYRDIIGLKCFAAMADNQGVVNPELPAFQGCETIETGQTWKGRDVNGEMYQGVDVNHKEVFFEDSLCGTDVDITFRLWSGLEGGGIPTEQEHQIARADLAWLDEKADDFYYMASMVWQTIEELDSSDPIQHELRRALDGACHCIDWSYPGSEGFYESVHQADDELNKSIDSMDKSSMINVYCVGHTHIDVA